jgi:diaminohydroxyphosphoribosylaminopyrimidine deaminase / 5-amino-6-(5-phosphoribosylamino)uracil reductase
MTRRIQCRQDVKETLTMDMRMETDPWSRLLAGETNGTGRGRQDDFVSLYAPIAEAPGRFVLGQLGQSLDGRIATPTGHSRTIGCAEAIAHLHRLRALSDAVVVGIGTVVADDPQLTVREVAGPNPVRVVIDPNGRLPPNARMLAEDGVDCIAVQARTQQRPSRLKAVTLPSQDGRLDVHALVDALAARGLHRLLIEGGGHTVSAFLAAGALHRLHVCVAPVLIGSGLTGLCLPPIALMEEAMRPRCITHRIGNDVLFDFALTEVSDQPAQQRGHAIGRNVPAG